MTKLRWQTYDDAQGQLSTIEKDWLFDRGSLTKRLTDLSQNKFSLEILSEGTQFLREDECAFFNISAARSEWVREVVLKGNNIPWVYARSVILSNYSKNNNIKSFIHKGKQPLGTMLFDKDRFDRAFIEITHYPEEMLSLKYSCADLWARRSCFKNSTQTILVQEIFLPDFWKCLMTT